MMLSYLVSPFSGDEKRQTVKAKITTEHSASSYGQPVIVLPDGSALDLMSWVGCGYTVVKATNKEIERLQRILQLTTLSTHMSEIGKIGGSAKSDRKTAAVRENAKKGGRPRKEEDK